jgi:hypothetical protein
MSRGRWILLLGGVLLLAACVGLTVLAGATVRSFEVLTWRIEAPPPESLLQHGYVAGLAGLFAVGWIVACGGISSPSEGKTVTLAGRILYAAAGLLTMASAGMLIYGTVALRSVFLILATSQTSPKPAELDMAIESVSWCPVTGFAIATVAALLVVLAAVAGWRTANAQHGQGPAPLRSMIVIGVTALLAVPFALFFILNSRHGAVLQILLVSGMPKPSDLAGHLVGILNNSLYAYLILLLLGFLQIVAAVLAPAVSGDRRPEATA